MDWLKHGIDLILHLDKHVNALANDYGPWTYLILFAIIFGETGLVVTPFLPGDSLLFAVGALAAMPGSPINIYLAFLLLSAAAVLGNTTNYQIGRWMGPRALNRDGRFLKKKYLDKTHEFFERYGGLTIMISRFMPIVRTFAPFVAGVGRMPFLRFQAYNIAGGIGWVALLLWPGYFFGGLPLVKNNFSLVIGAIVVISILPGVVGYWRSRRLRRQVPGPRCPGCGYSLHGLTRHQCPECGLAFDPQVLQPRKDQP
jgi:membrane-associated protein